jgi:hypothetical protein
MYYLAIGGAIALFTALHLGKEVTRWRKSRARLQVADVKKLGLARTEGFSSNGENGLSHR